MTSGYTSSTWFARMRKRLASRLWAFLAGFEGVDPGVFIGGVASPSSGFPTDEGAHDDVANRADRLA
jgi:hypothetical protein